MNSLVEYVQLETQLKVTPNDKLTPGHIHGFWIDLPNGWTVSVQFGPGHYGSNYDGHFLAPPVGHWHATEAEVWAWKGEKPDRIYYPEDIEGWKTIAEVLEFIKEVASK